MKKVELIYNSSSIIKHPMWQKTIAKLVIAFIVILIIFLTFTPWIQTSKGYGEVLALDPNDRIQNFNSSVTGRIKKWHVQEGDYVKQGDLIVELEDLDPNFINRLEAERDQAFKKLEVTKIAAETANINYKRQKELYEKGLSSRVKYEKAKIDYKKYLSDEASAATKLVTIETKLSRQMTQEIRAPKAGQILKVLQGAGNVIVNDGDVLAVFLPDTNNQAVQIFVPGNDLPLITPGRKVRLQFEGWPAVQISGEKD